jgi:hypothetical protein
MVQDEIGGLTSVIHRYFLFSRLEFTVMPEASPITIKKHS